MVNYQIDNVFRLAVKLVVLATIAISPLRYSVKMFIQFTSTTNYKQTQFMELHVVIPELNQNAKVDKEPT